jgi:hypothetical protein
MFSSRCPTLPVSYGPQSARVHSISPFAIEKPPKLHFREMPLEVEVEMHFRQ